VDNTFLFRVGIQQPLFTGFRLTGLADAAEAQAQAGALAASAGRADLILNVSSAFWACYQAERLDTLAGENTRRLEAYRADVQRLMQAGLATQNDVLKIEVQLAAGRLAKIEAENERDLAAMTLNNLIGNPLDAAVVPVGDPLAALDDSLLKLAVGGADAILSGRAAELRADLGASRWMTEAARANLSAARGSWWPQIDLTANYYYNNPNSRYQPVTPEFLESWDVGVNLAMELWTWGRTGYAVDQAEAALKMQEQQHAQAMESVTLEVRRAALGARRSREKLDVALLGVAQARENLRITEEKFRTGLATSSDLLDAQVALTQAETQLTASSVEVALAGARLARAVGREDE
jgi:outer membrane protein TolC